MQPFIPLPHPHPQRSNKIIIQQQLFPQKEPPPQPLFPKKFMCISFIFLILCDFPLCHFYLFLAQSGKYVCSFVFQLFFFCFYFILLYKTKFGYKLQKKLHNFFKDKQYRCFATTNFAYKYFGLYVKKVCFIELKVL